MPLEQSPAEIDAFAVACDRLSGFDDRIGAEWADGYLTALAAGPRAIGIDEWLSRMCGDAFGRCFADPADAAAAHGALAARARWLSRQLDPERLLDAPEAMHLAPYIGTWDADSRALAVAEGVVPAGAEGLLVSGAEWSRGFADAMTDFAGDWSPTIDAEEQALFEDLKLQVAVLGWSADGAEMQIHLATFKNDEGFDGPPDRDALIDIACSAVQDLRVWWLDHGTKPATVHAALRPGRNQPCHCGSGKKFKKCHGA